MAMAGTRVVAGTIMVTNAQGESFFLVEKNGDSISFLNKETESGGKLPMGIIMKHLLEFVEIEADSLRLIDLANLKAEENNVSLFVFDVVERPDNPDTLLSDSDDVVWRRSKELTTLLDAYDFGIVPIYK